MYLGPISLISSIRLPMALTEEQMHIQCTRNDIHLQDQVSPSQQVNEIQTLHVDSFQITYYFNTILISQQCFMTI